MDSTIGKYLEQFLLLTLFIVKMLKLIMASMVMLFGISKIDKFIEMKVGFIFLFLIYATIYLIYFVYSSNKRLILSSWNTGKSLLTFFEIYGLVAIVFTYGANHYLMSLLWILFLVLPMIDIVLKEIDVKFFSKKTTKEVRKRNLIHELGHFLMTKNLINCTPNTIFLESTRDSFARISVDGNMESNHPYDIAKLLLAGTVASTYLLESNNEFIEIDNELNDILLSELKSCRFSVDFTATIKNLSYDKSLLISFKNEIVRELDSNRVSILDFAEKNCMKNEINVKGLIL